MILDPPPAYDHPHAGSVVEWIMRAPQVDGYCRKAGVKLEHGQVIGCAFKIGETCFIVISRHAIPVLRRHEVAHCNGWEHE